MAFTLQQVENALSDNNGQTMYGLLMNEDISNNINYHVIVDYLTGASNSLSGIQPDYSLQQFTPLINLLENIEDITINDQLIIDLFLDSNTQQFIATILNQWLLSYMVNTNTDASFKSTMRLFKLQGVSDEHIFNSIIYESEFNNRTFAEIQDTSTYPFLLQFVKQHTGLTSFVSNRMGWGRDVWSKIYFQLLEIANTAMAEAYAVESIFYDSQETSDFIIQHKAGKYLPIIESELNKKSNQHFKQAHSKLQFATQINNTPFAFKPALVIQLSKSYLESYTDDQSGMRWENTIALTLTDLDDKPMPKPTSTVAFYFLLKHDKALVFEAIDLFITKKKLVNVETLMMFHHLLGLESFVWIDQLYKKVYNFDSYYFPKLLQFLSDKFEPSVYTPLLWTFANNKAKVIRAMLAKFLAEKDSNAADNAIEKLEHKNAEVRQTAAMLLGYFPGEKTRVAVMKLLNSESNDNTRDVLLEAIEANLPTAATDEFVSEMIAAANERGKLTKPILPATIDESLPTLFHVNGEPLTRMQVRFLCYRMSRVKEMRSDIEARYLLWMIDKERSNDFALALISIFKQHNTKPEDKWMMALAALLGDDSIVGKLKTLINNWIDENRFKMAEYGVAALALQGSDAALRWVEWYSRKYKSKKANIGAAAMKALESAAEQQGISIQELGDKVVPDFGFDGLFKPFQVSGEGYRAFIDSNFKFAFFDEDNKKLKVIPAAADKVIKEEFKNIAKEIRDVVKSQTPRLEYYLIIQRRWTYTNWQQFFLQNPVMFIFATKILWAVFDDENKVTQTFMCNEDTSLLNAEGDEVAVEENAAIGILHPSQITTSELQQWETVFFDMKIDPVFPQLSRHLPDMSVFDLEEKIVTKYIGKKTKVGSIRSVLEKLGWSQGPVGDGGMVESFKVLYLEKKIEAILEVEGVGAGYGWGTEEKLNQLYFVDKAKVTQKWFYPKHKDDENLVRLKEVPYIFLNEIFAAIELIKTADL